MPPGACGGGIAEKPLNSGYILLNQQEYFNSRMYDFKPSKTLNRNDIIFTFITNLLYATDSDTTLDSNNVIGFISGKGLGIDYPSRPDLRIWAGESQISLNRNKLFNNKKQDDDYLRNLVIISPLLASTIFESTTKRYIDKNINSVLLGSDGKYYYVREIPKRNYEPNSKLLEDNSIFDTYFVYKMEVYESKEDADKALSYGEKKNNQIKNGETEILKLVK